MSPTDTVRILIETIDQTPADRTTWLVLADALDEIGRHDEATLIRATERVAIDANDGNVYDRPTYRLEMRSPCGTRQNVEYDEEPSDADCDEATVEYVSEGEWGNEGASLDYRWTLYAVTTEGEEEVSEGRGTVEIEPDHDAMIRAAGGDTDCDHEWTSEGEGGLSENPGVCSTGGTSMRFASHCRACGLHRTEFYCGIQKNPGEHDTVSYEQPDSWCAECHSEECTCETDEAE